MEIILAEKQKYGIFPTSNWDQKKGRIIQGGKIVYSSGFHFIFDFIKKFLKEWKMMRFFLKVFKN